MVTKKVAIIAHGKSGLLALATHVLVKQLIKEPKMSDLTTPVVKRPNSPEMDKLLGQTNPVLDHGFIRVVDYMGNDDAIVQAARVSYGEGTKTPSDDRSLIRYLMSHRHSTPFEMCEIKLHVKLPIFVARQWIRHRTANVNEYSARYSILAREFYIPEIEDILPQSKTNKQGRSGELDEKTTTAMRETIRQQSEMAYQIYEELHTGSPWFDPNGTPWDQWEESPEKQEAQYRAYAMAEEGNSPYPEVGHGMAREMARMVVPPNVYTEWYWKVDLHNLFHFLSLRADPHAQMEIRAYASVICDLVAAWCPRAMEAWEDYVYFSQRFSKHEMDVLKALAEKACQNTAPNFLKDLASLGELNTREQREFINKLGLGDT